MTNQIQQLVILFFQQIFFSDFFVSEDIHGLKNVKSCDKILCSELKSIPHLITRIGSERLKCIQKQQYKDIYRFGGRISTKTPSDVDKSIGDDVEDFYNRIKTNAINICMQYSIFDQMTLPNQISSLAPLSDSISTVRTFHVSMLTDKEESEMSLGTNLTRLGRIKFFKNRTALSKHEQNYALSLCARRTFFLGYLNRYHEHILFHNCETDMARIMDGIIYSPLYNESKEANSRTGNNLPLHPWIRARLRVSLDWTESVSEWTDLDYLRTLPGLSLESDH